jgi:hypothetical protein
MCHKGAIAFSVLIDEAINPTNQTLHLPTYLPTYLPLSIPEDKLYSKPNAMVKLKVVVRVTYSAEFAVLEDFVISFIMKKFMELRCYFLG